MSKVFGVVIAGTIFTLDTIASIPKLWSAYILRFEKYLMGSPWRFLLSIVNVGPFLY
jgi:hypothetical protein